MITLYRVEDTEGRGPWASRAFRHRGVPFAERDRLRHGAWMPNDFDDVRHALRDYRCAVQDPSLLDEWFDARILKHGFSLVAYEVSDARHGRYQSVFDPTHVLSRTIIA